MGTKKLISDVFHSLLAHWITNGVLVLMGLGIAYWGWVADHWSWPVAVTIGIVIIAAELPLEFRLPTASG